MAKISKANITISDIAESAGVSKATVSRVLNSPELVDEKTREKIEKVIKENHYSPSATARNLSKQISSTIGVIVPEISNTFFGELFEGIEEITNKNNLSLLYCSNDDNKEKDFKALDMMRTQRVRGLIYIPAVNYKELGLLKQVQQRLDGLAGPVICVDRSIGLRCDEIYFNDRKAMYEAVKALAVDGHKRIAIINGSKQNVLAEERHNGYIDGLKESGIEVDESIIFRGDYKYSSAYSMTKQMIKLENQPTAVITCNNSISKGFLKAIYETGKSIPDAYMHIGLDKIEMLNLLGIPYNHIERDSYELGKRAVEILINRIAFPETKLQQVVLQAELELQTCRLVKM
ncbi:MAG: LacI family DNA-binding transcriptional regulator [Herbinix sp.]|nr:LacI family DNA-binding transcriptional regulator [Herbinix sp.]